MDWTNLLRPETRFQLLRNHKDQQDKKGTGREIDFEPVCRLHIEGTDMHWLLTECDGEGYAFGLCQVQVAELGTVWLPELAELDLPGLQVVEDLNFRSAMPLSGYSAKARSNGGFLSL